MWCGAECQATLTGVSGDSWRAGRDAWRRLTGWQPGEPYGGHPGGEGALAALDDVGTLRRMLDRAELAAVRAARRHGNSWAEIATCLGITRQSAWERWHDLDDAAESARDAAAVELVASAERAPDPPGEGRRARLVRVPDLVGRTWPDARSALRDRGLVAAGPDREDLDAVTAYSSGWVVVAQAPESGAKVSAGAHVTIWLDHPGGGSAGVREPRRPMPKPHSGQARAVPSEIKSSEWSSG